MLTSRRPTLRTAAEVTAGILILLGLHGWMQYLDADAALHEQRHAPNSSPTTLPRA